VRLISPGNWRIRLGAAILAFGVAVYIPWMLANLNTGAFWLAIPFAVANLLLAVNALATAINNWQRAVPPPRLLPPGDEPVVALLIPTYGEPAWMVRNTAVSTLEQDWPRGKLRLVISDDAHSPAIAEMTARLRDAYPDATILYHEPPRHGSPDRPGDAKAGNLNSALAMLYARFPEIAVVETRDADDEVGDRQFLRRCLGELFSHPRIAFVQTIKDAHVSPGDPFGNREWNFYRGLMFGKHAANTVFPCGSGVVWRREALEEIGRFPTWNLVEDLQSGIEALCRGWHGSYVPVVGAVAQHAPEDIPTVYKQRGTWAIDTMRLIFWRGFKGMRLRQRLHFYEMGLFYVYGFSALFNMLSQAITLLFRVYPLRPLESGHWLLGGFAPFNTMNPSYGPPFWIYALSIEIFLICLKDLLPYSAIWRMRQIWLGLAPVYARSVIIALVSGPRRKPVYRVTRKMHRFRWYWRETWVQSAIWLLMFGALIAYLVRLPSLRDIELGLVGWCVFHLFMLGGFVRRSWFGVNWRERLAPRALPQETATAPIERGPAD
jgi:cellulose synthase (UDP-forming)